MNVLHVVKLFDRKANGIRTVVPSYIYEQAKYENVFLQNITGLKIECEEYQLDFESKGWPFNIKDKEGNDFVPNLVVFHGYYSIEMLKLARILYKNKIPYIVVPHGCFSRKAQATKRLKKIIGNIVFFDRFAKRAAAIQFLSQNELNNSVSKNKNCFISTNPLAMPKTQKAGFNENKMIFSYIGRYDIHIKGIDLLIKAISDKKELLIRNNCEFRFYGPRISIYEQKIEMIESLILQNGVSDLISMNDGVFGEEKEQRLLETDVFIQCSRTEAMPMGILEAMSYGVPCLITRGTSLAGLLDKYDAGWSCETTAEAIADAIEKAISEKKLLTKKSANAIAAVKENFDPETVAKQTIENYRNFI